MSEYKPPVRTQITLLASLLLVVLPAIWFAGMGYMWFIVHGLKFDINERPDGILDRLLILVMVFPMTPVMLLAILISGIPWMFVVSRVLSWADIQYFSKQKGPRFPFLSDWLDGLWLHMIERRKPENPNSESSQ